VISISPIILADNDGDRLDLQYQNPTLRGGTVPGRWVGEGAVILNLKGSIWKNDLQQLMEGVSPNGKVRLVKNALNPERTSAWHIKIDASKSATALWSEAPNGYRAKIEEAHQFAVSCVFRKLEEKLSGPESLPSTEKRRLTGALFESFAADKATSLQSSLLLLNIGLCLDGPNKEFQDRSVLKESWTLSELYESRLQSGLKQRFGLHFEQGFQGPEIQGVPQKSQCGTTFSEETRTQEHKSFWQKCSAILNPKPGKFVWNSNTAKELLHHSLSKKRLKERLAQIEKKKERKSQQKTAAQESGNKKEGAKTESQSKGQSQSH
jgi:conjugative relaxase-like TrwC/TraI family protein